MNMVLVLDLNFRYCIFFDAELTLASTMMLPGIPEGGNLFEHKGTSHVAVNCLYAVLGGSSK